MSSISSRFFLTFFFAFLGSVPLSTFRFTDVRMIESVGPRQSALDCTVVTAANVQLMSVASKKTPLTACTRNQVQIITEGRYNLSRRLDRWRDYGLCLDFSCHVSSEYSPNVLVRIFRSSLVGCVF